MTLLAEEERLVSCEPAPLVSPRLEESVLMEAEKVEKEEEVVEVSQVISMEEDGRLGVCEDGRVDAGGEQRGMAGSERPETQRLSRHMGGAGGE